MDENDGNDAGESGMSKQETLEDARLRDSATDLLEALKEMLAYSGIIEERDSNYATNKARAAIRKATGE
jgi:hypothetical protein